MKKITTVFMLFCIIFSFVHDTFQQRNTGVLQKTIYEFLKGNPSTTKFIELLARASLQTNDQSVVNILSATNAPNTPSIPLTVFCPINEALNQMPSDPDQLRNDIFNLVVKEILTLDKLRNPLGLNITKTYGFMPKLMIKAVKNFYARQSDIARRKRQSSIEVGSMNRDKSIYDQYSELYGVKPTHVSDGLNISPKMPQDELYLLNNAVVLDKIDLINGIVYIINLYPRYSEKSIYLLMKNNLINGLSQNLNFWVTRADQALKAGDENLKNALNSFGPATYFLPTDQAISKFNDRDKINNNTFVFDMLLRSQRISNKILFDYYLDDPSTTHLTDTGLPVSTIHKRINGQDIIEVSIGHVKGRILPEFRNIYCTSGVIHLIDSILVTPVRNAYQQISTYPELRQMLEAAPRQNLYPTILDKPTTRPPIGRRQVNQEALVGERIGIPYAPDFKYMTILAPNDDSLLASKDEIMKSDTSIEEFLSAHIIQDRTGNKVYYTHHDQSIFMNNQAYYTLSSKYILTARVVKDQSGSYNFIGFRNATNSQTNSNIVSGNDRVTNGVIHIIDRPITYFPSSDIPTLLDKYANSNTARSPAFSLFVEAMKTTGIYNDLRNSAKEFTIFIPTNNAFAKYQELLNSGDLEKKKKLVYRHICFNDNLQSSILNDTGNLNLNPTTSSSGLVCRNALGQELTFGKEKYGLVSTWQGMAVSRIINDFQGNLGSAYLIEQPLFNKNLPNMGINGINSSSRFSCSNSILMLFLLLIFLEN